MSHTPFKEYLLTQLRKKHACNAALTWVRTLPDNVSVAEAYSACGNVDWILWLLQVHHYDQGRPYTELFRKCADELFEWFTQNGVHGTAKLLRDNQERELSVGAVCLAAYYAPERVLETIKRNFPVSIIEEAIARDQIECPTQ